MQLCFLEKLPMESKSTGWHLAVTVLISGFYLDRNYNLFICRYCVTFNMWKFLSIMLVFNMGIAFLISDWFSLSINPEMTSDGFRHFYQPLQTHKIPIHPVNNILILFFDIFDGLVYVDLLEYLFIFSLPVSFLLILF